MVLIFESTNKQNIMDALKIKELLAKVDIYFTVYDIVYHEIPGVLNGRQLNAIEHFDSEMEAELFILENVTSYHSLTIIKRYE